MPTPVLAPRWGLWAATAVFASWFVGAVLASVIGVAVWGKDATTNPWALSLIIVVQSAVTLVALLVVSYVRGQRSLARDFGFYGFLVDLIWFPAGFGLQVVGSIVLLPITRLAGEREAPQQLVQVLQHTSVWQRVPLVVCVVFIAPVIEELMFRGILLRSLQRWVRVPIAILITAVIFALFHLGDANAVLVLPVLLAVGILAGWLATRTGRLGPSIALHAGFNFTAVLLLFLT